MWYNGSWFNGQCSYIGLGKSRSAFLFGQCRQALYRSGVEPDMDLLLLITHHDPSEFFRLVRPQHCCTTSQRRSRQSRPPLPSTKQSQSVAPPIDYL